MLVPAAAAWRPVPVEAPVPLTRARAPTGVRICVQSTVTVKDALESMKKKALALALFQADRRTLPARSSCCGVVE